MTRAVLVGSAFLAATMLGGCTDMSRALGLVKSPPDEFTVVSSTPLTLPPDYGLRPPRSSSDKPLGATPTDKARQTVFGVPNANAAGPGAIDPNSPVSPGEQALLVKAKAGEVDPSVRARVDQESKQALDQNKGFIDGLMFWKSAPIPGEALDASKESERLQENVPASNAVEIDRTQHSDIEDKP